MTKQRTNFSPVKKSKHRERAWRAMRTAQALVEYLNDKLAAMPVDDPTFAYMNNAYSRAIIARKVAEQDWGRLI